MTRVELYLHSRAHHHRTGWACSWLHLRNVDWYEHFEFSYDMSLPNVAHLDPQRGGCCTVMPFFIGNIVELPVTCTQDYTILHILDDYSIDLWVKQTHLIREKNGLISFIVHPDYILAQRARKVYKELLGYLAALARLGSIDSLCRAMIEPREFRS